ncbi:carbon monoxide dehydrogenase subunit G [Arthrobacter stackebrandtii]|uniref:Carbon monoxide dehydrogenase subunit G n=1 Tax=Arthrobacter stackebrandtii TaxID=272161 RepID=A0ABS4Z3G8_9MICC|nr:SRPBCC family protein [Arthrobacter stackebrandtii]MBP2414793.1 carbon monoxide dehydrogenase subunit G [Arthrobacter stackebrandtii]PYG99454.1 carbon monoxide dehydrogenase [Arthrobacter stackebrandtii]
MELKHHFTVPTPLEDTWHSFNQLEEIAPCFPGATLTGVEGDTFTGTVKVKLGPIAMMYAGTGQFLSRDEASHTVVIEAQGKDKRGNGTAGATVTAVLSAAGSGTQVDVSTDMNVTGKPAQFGRGVIQDISDKLLEQFVQCVIKKAEEPEAAVEAPAGSVPPPVAAAPAPVTAATPGTPAPPAPPQGSSEPRHAAPPPPHPGPPAAAAELDLGSAILPVLAKRFAPLLAAAAVLVLVVACCRRRRK